MSANARKATTVWFEAIDSGRLTRAAPAAVLEDILADAARAGDAVAKTPERWPSPWDDLDRKNRRSGRLLVVDLIGTETVGPEAANSKWYLAVKVDDMQKIAWYELCSCSFRNVASGDALRIESWTPGGGPPSEREARVDPESHDDATEKTDRARRARLRTAYLSAKTQHARRDIAFEAISTGVVREGTKISIVDELFGTSCARDQSGQGVCNVDFLPYHLMPEPKNRIVHAAWYADFLYDADGRVVCYSLSNFHIKG